MRFVFTTAWEEELHKNSVFSYLEMLLKCLHKPVRVLLIEKNDQELGFAAALHSIRQEDLGKLKVEEEMAAIRKIS